MKIDNSGEIPGGSRTPPEQNGSEKSNTVPPKTFIDSTASTQNGKSEQGIRDWVASDQAKKHAQRRTAALRLLEAFRWLAATLFDDLKAITALRRAEPLYLPAESTPRKLSLKKKVLAAGLLVVAGISLTCSVLAVNGMLTSNGKLEAVSVNPALAWAYSFCVLTIAMGIHVAEETFTSDQASRRFQIGMIAATLSFGCLWLLIVPWVFGLEQIDIWNETGPASTGRDWGYYLWCISQICTETTGGSILLSGGLRMLSNPVNLRNPKVADLVNEERVIFTEYQKALTQVANLEAVEKEMAGAEENLSLEALARLATAQRLWNELEQQEREVKREREAARQHQEAAEQRIAEMKKRFNPGAAAAVIGIGLFAFSSLDSQAESFVMGLPMNCNLEAYRGPIGVFCMQQLRPGDSLEVYSASGTFARLATIAIPNKKAYATNQRLRARAIQGEMAKLGTFIKASASRFNADEPTGQLRVIEFVEFVGGLKPGEPQTIVLIGNGRRLWGEERFRMTDDLIPNQALMLGSRESNPYGTDGREDFLTGKRVHFATIDTPFEGRQKEAVESVWGTIMSQEGGSLVTFEADLGLVLQRAVANPKAKAKRYEVRAKDGEEQRMIRIRYTAPEWMMTEPEKPLVRATDGESTQAAPKPLIGPVSCGIQWKATGVDLDIYCQAQPGAERLFFGKVKNADGSAKFFKDFTSPPGETGREEFEWIEYKKDVSLEALSIWINIYAGDAPQGVPGKVKILFGGKTYEAPFSFPPTKGNKGAATGTEADKKFWISVNPVSVVTSGQIKPDDPPSEE